MSLVINHNLMAMNAARNLGTIYNRLASSTQRLSSGLRVNSAADDAAGLAIRELMRADIATFQQGIRNASDGISLIQTAEGAMAVIDEKLTRMKELAEQAATGTYTTLQREIMDSEYQAMAAEIDRIANATNFNGVRLLDGSITNIHDGSGMKIHFGAGNDASEDYYFIQVGDVRATSRTGLQIGGGRGLQSIITSSGAGAASIDAPMFISAGAAANFDEYVGFWYNASAGTGTPTANPSYLVGFYQLTNGEDTLADLVDNINAGAAERIGFTFSSAAGTQITASSANAYSISVGNTTAAFFFESAWAVTGTPTLLFDTSGVADVAADFTSAWNNLSGANTYAIRVAGTNNILFFEKDPIINGPSLSFNDVSGTASSFYFYDVENGTVYNTIGSMGMGDENWIRAQAIQDTDGNLELRITGADPGEDYDVVFQDISPYLTNEGAWAATLSGFTNWVQTQNASAGPSWAGAHITTQSHAQEALGALDSSILRKDIVRANLGAYQNRLENTITNLSIQAENLQASESRISDIDVATEMTEFTRNNILAQAAVSMLAQANTLPQLALSLMG